MVKEKEKKSKVEKSKIEKPSLKSKSISIEDKVTDFIHELDIMFREVKKVTHSDDLREVEKAQDVVASLLRQLIQLRTTATQDIVGYKGIQQELVARAAKLQPADLTQ